MSKFQPKSIYVYAEALEVERDYLKAKLEAMISAVKNVHQEFQLYGISQPIKDTNLAWFIRLAVETAAQQEKEDA